MAWTSIRRVGLLAALVTGAAWPGHPSAQSQAADLILINGTVLTVDARDSIAQAVAVAGNRIVAVGSTDEIKGHGGAATEVIDLRGRTVTPGLIDTHVHFTEADALFTVDLGDPAIKTIEQAKQRVAEQVKRLKPGEWVRGRGWDEGKYAEKRYITAADLDAVAPNNPVWLTHTTGHYGVGNSYALKMAEVRRDTKDPPAGTIDRDAQGAPTGVMKEAAMGLVSRLVPPLTRDQQKQGLARIVEDFNKEGMTAAKDPGIGPAKWELYQELLREGKLTVRVFALWSGARRLEDRADVLARVKAAPRQAGLDAGGVLMSGGVKMFMDGSGGARTAWMHDDWNKNLKEIDTGNKGYPSTPPDVYRQIVTELHDAGVHVSTHAIGDRAIDWVVDTYDRALQARPTRGLRHGIIHANTPTDHAIDVMARLQREYDAAFPESSATFMWWIGDNYAGNLGPARNLRLKPFRTYTKKQVRWSGGSDYSVTPFPARYGLWASVARETLNGTYGSTPFGRDEAVDVKTALRSYTAWAAHQLFLDDRVGSIEVGKEADLAVWDRNPYEIAPAALKDLRCELTVVRGKVVYRAAQTASPAPQGSATSGQSSAPGPARRRESPPQPQQTQGPDYFAGVWRATWTGRESPVSTGPRSGTVTFTRRGTSNVVDVRAEGTSESGAPYKENGRAEWDATGKTLTIVETLAGGAELRAVGDWSSPIAIRAESAPVTIGGQTVKVRRLYSILSADSFMVTEELSIDGGPYQRLGNGRFQKVP